MTRFFSPSSVAVRRRTTVSRGIATDSPAALIVGLGIAAAVVFGGLMVSILGPVVGR